MKRLILYWLGTQDAYSLVFEVYVRLLYHRKDVKNQTQKLLFFSAALCTAFFSAAYVHYIYTRCILII